MEIDHELTPFNIKKLVNNGHTTRILFESEKDTFICEIIGPIYQQSPQCQFKIQIENNELLKRDILSILRHLVMVETYQKQAFTINFDQQVPYNKAINALFYGILLHGIRIRDSFTACSAQLDENNKLQVDKQCKSPLAKMNLVYSVNQQKILCQDIRGKFSSDELGLLMSGCISGCIQTYHFIKEL